MSRQSELLVCDASKAELLSALDALGYFPLLEAADCEIEEEFDRRGLYSAADVLESLSSEELEEELFQRGFWNPLPDGIGDGAEQAYLSMHSADKTAFNEWAEKAILLLMGRAV